MPIDNSIFYVDPSTWRAPVRNRFSRLNFVAVTYGEHAVLDTSVTDAVNNLLAGTIPDAETSVLHGSGTSTGPRHDAVHVYDHDAAVDADHGAAEGRDDLARCSPRRTASSRQANAALASRISPATRPISTRPSRR